ncbi:hypothetical protein VTL71DRAFT_1878 [Oculimacula yallundae]|uniref:Uncharacterized protein n=1 Tax=Oculimacula yallundae TaxID=86028 RepID=A0ABR4CBX8_9HELO
MPSTLTFGVELEFLMAYLPDDVPSPDPSEKRMLHFPYTDSDIEEYYEFTKDEPLTRDTDERGGRLISAMRQVRIALERAGLLLNNVGETDFGRWSVTKDESVDKLEDSDYEWLQIEVVSPAYYFTPEALVEVRLALRTLKKNFCLMMVETAGLHIHVGDGHRSFDVKTATRLAAFVWAFEAQLHSVHPQHRQNLYYTKPLRGDSVYAFDYRERYNRTPSGITGALDLLVCKDFESLGAKIAHKYVVLKQSEVNFTGIIVAARISDYPKKTVEWRQHKGTFDGDEIANWISTVVGIMYFVRDASKEYFFGTLKVALSEEWQKLGDGKDDDREAKYGPILAESRFPINRLLRLLMLDDEAEYYSKRWHVLQKGPLESPQRSKITWDYEQQSVPGSEEYSQYEVMRGAWEDLTILKDIPGSKLTFDPDHTMWPSHSLREDTPDPETTDEDEDDDEETNSSALPRQEQEQDTGAPPPSITPPSPITSLPADKDEHNDREIRGSQDEERESQELDRQIQELEDSEVKREEEESAELDRRIAILEEERATLHLPLGDREWRRYMMAAGNLTSEPDGVSDPFAVGVERLAFVHDVEQVSPKTKPVENAGIDDVVDELDTPLPL